MRAFAIAEKPGVTAAELDAARPALTAALEREHTRRRGAASAARVMIGRDPVFLRAAQALRGARARRATCSPTEARRARATKALDAVAARTAGIALTMPFAYLCDFDGTISPEDIGAAFVEVSAGRDDDRERLLGESFAGGLGHRELTRRECELVTATEEEALEFGRTFRLDPALRSVRARGARARRLGDGGERGLRLLRARSPRVRARLSRPAVGFEPRRVRRGWRDAGTSVRRSRVRVVPATARRSTFAATGRSFAVIVGDGAIPSLRGARAPASTPCSHGRPAPLVRA